MTIPAEKTDIPTYTIKDRQNWLAILARANPTELAEKWEKFAHKPRYIFLRQPESGLMMARGRAGGSGAQFNLGEVTVTRCTIRLENGTTGHGYVRGRDKKQAEFVAIFDALMQEDRYRHSVQETIITPIAQKLQQQKEQPCGKSCRDKS